MVTASPANCLYICAPCHDYVEKHRRWGIDAGFLVSSYTADPASVPIRHSTTRTVYLHHDGTGHSYPDTGSVVITHGREEGSNG